MVVFFVYLLKLCKKCRQNIENNVLSNCYRTCVLYQTMEKTVRWMKKAMLRLKKELEKRSNEYATIGVVSNGVTINNVVRCDEISIEYNHIAISSDNFEATFSIDEDPVRVETYYKENIIYNKEFQLYICYLGA